MAFDPENPFYNVGVDFAARVQEMIAAAAEEGITLVLASGYRTDEDQQGLFEDNYVLDPAGTIEWPAGSGQMWRQTGTLVAPPGSSLHELGHAMDFAVAADPAAAEQGNQETADHGRDNALGRVGTGGNGDGKAERQGNQGDRRPGGQVGQELLQIIGLECGDDLGQPHG